MKNFLLIFSLLNTGITLSYAESPFLQHAQNYQSGINLSDYWVSEKLDGVRAYWDGNQLMTRRGFRIPAPEWFVKGFPKIALDGELWSSRGEFEFISSTVRKHQPQPEQWRRLRYMVFDAPKIPGSFSQRLVRYKKIIEESDAPYLQWIRQDKVSDEKTLFLRLEETIAAGGEGLMLHHVQAMYLKGRQKGLLKLKKIEDAEGTVIAYSAGKGKYLGEIGALWIEDDKGLKFKLGSGLTDVMRENPPSIGTVVTYRYSGLTSKGLPRFARFWRIRLVQ